MKSIDEMADVIVASDTTEALLGKEQRGGSPAQHHLGSPPAFDAPGPGLGSGKAAFDEMGRAERPHQRLRPCPARHRQRLFQAFLQTPRRVGTDRIQPLDARTQLLQGFVGRGFGPGSTQPPSCLWALFQRQRVQHIAQLVNAATLNQRPLPEDFPHPFVKRLGSIQNDEEGGLGVEPALAQVGQEFPDQRAVLGGSVPQAQDVRSTKDSSTAGN